MNEVTGVPADGVCPECHWFPAGSHDEWCVYRWEEEREAVRQAEFERDMEIAELDVIRWAQ